MIDIIIPTIGRADRIAPLAANITAATHSQHRIVFVTEAHDTATADAVRAVGFEPTINERSENYAGAVNTAYDHTHADWLFCGADDLVFSDGWDAECLSHDDGWFKVFGTNDLLNAHVLSGRHSTHSLVARDYLDSPGGVVDAGRNSFLPECYDHNFTDTEFIGTAKMRARFRPCLAAVVEHMHVTKTKVFDATHERSIRKFYEDEALYTARRDLWFGISR